LRILLRENSPPIGRLSERCAVSCLGSSLFLVNVLTAKSISIIATAYECKIPANPYQQTGSTAPGNRFPIRDVSCTLIIRCNFSLPRT
jgi:hypothetical protein